MKFWKPLFFLALVCCTALLLRLWGLNAIPAALNRDEAALGYNALLLSQTGRDEWQQSWPLALKSFGDYKLPGYVFATIPFLKILGAHDWVVRLPSAFAGVVLIALTYVFARRVLEWSSEWAVIAATVVAFQPVFFFFSRMAFEANVALPLLIAALWIMLEKMTQFSFSRVLVATTLLLAAVFTYNTPLLLLPVCLIAVIFWKGWHNWRSWGVWAALILVVGFIGGLQLLSLAQQKSGITLFSDATTWDQFVVYRDHYDGLSQKVLGNRYAFLAREIGSRWTMSLSPNFLVWSGGRHPWHALPDYGHIMIVVYGAASLGVAFGFGMLIKKMLGFSAKKDLTSLRQWILITLFAAASLLPASITVDAPHATRSLLFFWWGVLLAVWGLQRLWGHLHANKVTRVHRVIGWCFCMIVAVFFFAEAGGYLRSYFTHYPQRSALILQAGFAQALQEADQLKNSADDAIAIVDPDGYQYISAAWYQHLSAEEFFATITRHLPDRIGFQYGYKVGHYRFIAAARDRFPTEHILVEWHPDTGRWSVQGNL